MISATEWVDDEVHCANCVHVYRTEPS